MIILHCTVIGLLHNLIQTDFTVRVGEILADNGVEFGIDTLDAMVRANYPTCAKQSQHSANGNSRQQTTNARRWTKHSRVASCNG